jgi:hypothetical protein
MNHRKKQNTNQVNQLLEQRYFQNKFLNEDVKFTMGPNKDIIKMVDGKPEELSDEEKKETQFIKTTDDNEILKVIEKLNQKFGQK